MNKIKTVIFGCGSIAGYTRTGSKNYLNHAYEIKNNKNFQLIACIEKNRKKKIQFQKKYQVPYSFNNLETFMRANINYDLMVVCTTTEMHYVNLRKLLKKKVKNIFCEKPICETIKEFKILNKIIDTKKNNFFVNFNRKEDETVRNLKYIINQKIFGKIQFVRCIYGDGILNNGIHLIDLLFFLFNDIKLQEVVKTRAGFKNVSPSFTLKSPKEFPIYVESLKHNKFSIFEIDIIFNLGRIKYNDNGLKIEIFKVEKNKYFKKKYKLVTKPKIIKTQFLSSFKNIYQKIEKIILKKNLNLEFDNYKKVHKLCFDIINNL